MYVSCCPCLCGEVRVYKMHAAAAASGLFDKRGKKKWFAYLYEFPSKMILTRRVQKARDQTNEAIKGIRVQAGSTFVANSIRDVEVWTKNIFETFNSWISEI